MVSAHFLIINADDLGISPEVNRGIFTAYEQGVVTDSSLMMQARYTREAIEMIRAAPSFRVGIHINVDSLLGWKSPGQERFSRPELHNIMNGPEFVPKVKHAIAEQIEDFLCTGLIPSHIDTHHHVHGFPQIFEPLTEAMVTYGIKAIRFNKRGYSLMGRDDILITPETAQRMEDALREREIAYPQLLIDPLVPFSLQEIPVGVTELMVHPSSGGDLWRQKDFAMLMDPHFMRSVREEGIGLISFSELESPPFR